MFDDVAEYHRTHGDDYGSVESRFTKYRVILELCPYMGTTLLDVGCGEGLFRPWAEKNGYLWTGIDLLQGQNVLDYHEKHDVVVANGIFYKLEGPHWQVRHIIEHMWQLCNDVLIFNSLSTWTRGDEDEHELCLDPEWALEECRALTRKLVLRHDYAENDFTIALYR